MFIDLPELYIADYVIIVWRYWTIIVFGQIIVQAKGIINPSYFFFSSFLLILLSSLPLKSIFLYLLNPLISSSFLLFYSFSLLLLELLLFICFSIIFIQSSLIRQLMRISSKFILLETHLFILNIKIHLRGYLILS